MIVNPTPITPATMSGMWVANVRIQLPASGDPRPRIASGSFSARLLPYDGTHLLATGGKNVVIENLTSKRASDSTFDAVIASIIAEIERQAGKTGLTTLTVIAPDPARPVIAIGDFPDRSRHMIADCYALAATDEVFAGVFQSAMAEIARQAGLSVAD